MADSLSHAAAGAAALNPLAPAHLPSFLPGPDGSDPMMTSVLIGLILIVIAAGSFYLHLHSLPERLAHGRNSNHMELVAVLCLLALFTHNNFFWVAALVLVFLPVPDVVTPLVSIARSLRRLSAPEGAAVAGNRSRTRGQEAPPLEGQGAPVHGAASAGTSSASSPESLPVDMLALAATGRREAGHASGAGSGEPEAPAAREKGRDGDA
ncbi:hypothetical protein [Roseibium litorale]|uniref:Uncharacterized protein n=1 Tax=Roseibium litorale TaxID=2803841 RepID=A0ABR9CRD4_9HYPH|nr:hypothetical protein [Roseibium litorale]MBD8893436.1 hypothetical protein [Roseibium litorale]